MRTRQLLNTDAKGYFYSQQNLYQFPRKRNIIKNFTDDPQHNNCVVRCDTVAKRISQKIDINRNSVFIRFMILASSRMRLMLVRHKIDEFGKFIHEQRNKMPRARCTDDSVCYDIRDKFQARREFAENCCIA